MTTEIQKKPQQFSEWIQSSIVKASIIKANRTDASASNIAAMTVLAVGKSDKLQKCSHASILKCALECIGLGLLPDGVSGQAYLVPFKGVATLIIGYRGMIQLGYRSNQVRDIETRNVYSKEAFDAGTLEHTPQPPEERGEWIASFARVKLANGGVVTELMWASEIQKICDAALKKSYGKGPWKTDPEQMRRKTPMRRVFKYIPSSPQLQRAITLDELSDTDDSQFVEPRKTDEELRDQYAIGVDYAAGPDETVVDGEIIDQPEHGDQNAPDGVIQDAGIEVDDAKA